VRYLWRPNDRIDLNLIADYEKDDGDAFLWTVRSASGALAGQLASCGVTPGAENIDLCIDGSNSQVSESSGLSAQIDWTVGAHTLTSISATRWFDQDANSDSDSTSLNILNINSANQSTQQWSQELRLASPAAQRLSYVVGLYYFDYDLELETDQAGTLGVLPFVADRASLTRVEQLSHAAFGQATLRLTDAFSLVAGVRQTHEELDASLLNFTNTRSGVFFPGFSPPPGFATSEVDEDNFSYRMGAQYRFGESMAYLTYTEGYKGPALNVGTQGALANTVVAPEYPSNLELGIKTTLFDRRLNVEASVYDQTIEDFQAQISISTGGLVQFVFGNASELRVKGAQLNFSAAPARGLNLSGGVLYNDASYGQFIVPCNLPYTDGCTLLNGLPVIDVQGRQLARAPQWKLVFSGEYTFALSGGLDGFVGGTANYRSEAPNSAQPDPNLDVDAYTLVDARLGVRSANDRWTVSLFAKNLLDERFPSYTAREPLRPVGNYVQVFSPASFRTVGLALDWRFR
jgi:iron complex outermembrane receptor protein